VATRRKTAADILRQKFAILSKADEVFYEAVESTSRAIYKQVVGLMRKFTTKGGKYAPTETDNQILLRVQRQVQQAFAESTLGRKVEQFVKNFDKLDALNQEYYKVAHDLDIGRLKLTVAKKMQIEAIVQGLDAGKGLQVNVTQPLRQIIVRHVTMGSNVNEAEQVVRDYLLGKGQEGGKLLRYTRQLTMDALNQYNGTVQQAVADEYDMPKFRYVHSLIKTSRRNCIELVNGTGAFADLRQDDGTYLRADIPKIVQRAQGRAGWNPACTASTFFIYRGGYNCRHDCIPSL
jgi:hypothetical protein